MADATVEEAYWCQFEANQENATIGEVARWRKQRTGGKAFLLTTVWVHHLSLLYPLSRIHVCIFSSPFNNPRKEKEMSKKPKVLLQLIGRLLLWIPFISYLTQWANWGLRLSSMSMWNKCDSFITPNGPKCIQYMVKSTTDVHETDNITGCPGGSLLGPGVAT